MRNYIEEAKLKSIVNSRVVTDTHIADYLQGLEYGKWLVIKRTEYDISELEISFDEFMNSTVTVVVGQDEDGVDITEDQLVNVYVPVDVSVGMEQWKVANYAMLRKAEYPDIAEFVDAHVKGDTVALQAYIDKCLAVKVKYPK